MGDSGQAVAPRGPRGRGVARTRRRKERRRGSAAQPRRCMYAEPSEEAKDAEPPTTVSWSTRLPWAILVKPWPPDTFYWTGILSCL